MSRHWTFTPLDTWFFRESRPHGSVGGSELSSVFPPPARTLAGAVRTLIGEAKGIDWNRFKSEGDPDIGQSESGPEEFGKLQLTGPFITLNRKRLYPAPQFLFRKDDVDDPLWPEFPKDPVVCDLGEVRLPRVQSGSKPLSGYITEDGLTKLLKGESLGKEDCVKASKLYSDEPRLGIALVRSSRSAQDGMLYQTRHLRFAEDIAVDLTVDGIGADIQPSGSHSIRLGGEGRFAAVDVSATGTALPRNPAAIKDGAHIFLLALTDVLVPDDFDASKLDGLGLPEGLQLVSAVLGKAKREGGWDVANHAPRPVRSLIPAGSAWFCTVTDAEALKGKLDEHGCLRVGEETQIGRGLLVVGRWPEPSWNPGGGE